MCYKMLEDVPENVNAGRHRVTYSHVDKKVPAADVQFRKKSPVKEHHYQVPPCVFEAAQCGLKARK